MSDNETNYVAGLATRWASTDPMEQWVNAAPEGGRTPLEETIREYLGSHNPFPDESAVEVLRGDGSTWEQAVIVERVGVDEWTVEKGRRANGATITSCGRRLGRIRR